ncbi:MAG: PorV/PorQ family protein [Balneolaceae bacterium]|nr:PorV/PorQ family protein [Balneolaceae bacterium]
MKNTLHIIVLILLFLLPTGLAGAQSGMDFLNIGPTTQALALGEAVTAVPMGASAIYTNPANLAFDSSSSLSADYTLWIANVFNSHVAVNLKSGHGSIGFGLLSSNATDFEARSRPGPADGTFSVSYLSLAAAYARSIRNFSVGGAFQFLREEFLVSEATGYAFNAGVSSHWLDRRLRIGIALLNQGRMNELIDEPTPLPSTLRFGVAAEIATISPPRNDDLPIRISLYADYISPMEEDIRSSQFSHNPNKNFVNTGISLDIAETIVLRGGYKTGDTERPFGAGVAVRLESLSFNYAMVPFNTGFGNVHSVGMQYFF